MGAICGINCEECSMKDSCKGCEATGGCPFGGECLLAKCCRTSGYENCAQCADASCMLKARIMSEFNALGIPDLEEVKELYALSASYVNLPFTMPDGNVVKFWDDKKMLLGCQLHKLGSERCYGLAADDKYLMVCEYGDGGSDPEMVIYKRR